MPNDRASNNWSDDIRARLEKKLGELGARLERITRNVRSGLDADSEERAKQLEDSAVVDALGNEARAEIRKIKVALRRIEDGDYDACTRCGGTIGAERLAAYPYATACIDCAQLDEQFDARY